MEAFSETLHNFHILIIQQMTLSFSKRGNVAQKHMHNTIRTNGTGSIVWTQSFFLYNLISDVRTKERKKGEVKSFKIAVKSFNWS